MMPKWESLALSIINESVIEVNDKTINLMKDYLPDEMLENELPPKCLNEELT